MKKQKKEKIIVITADGMSNEGARALAAGIIHRAVLDYSKAIANKDIWEQESIESFFRSSWFSVLTDMDGEGVIRNIREKYKDMKQLLAVTG